MIDLQAVNDEFGIGERVWFEAGPGGLPVAELRSRFGSARVAVYGGQVLAYRPEGERPVIWLSEESFFEVGKAIRGGIPVCWPWFGSHPADRDKPGHGFARLATWPVLETGLVDGEGTQLRLGLVDNPATMALWPHAFQLELLVTLGEALRVELLARNTGGEVFSCTGALHSYFSVSDIGQVTVQGLDGCAYLDKVEGFRRKVQAGPVRFEGETDRVYLDTAATCVIEDRGWGRKIQVAKSGSRTTVVWNPGPARAGQLPDMGAEAYRGMVCVETANAAEDVVTLGPGEEHRLAAEIWILDFGF